MIHRSQDGFRHAVHGHDLRTVSVGWSFFVGETAGFLVGENLMIMKESWTHVQGLYFLAFHLEKVINCYVKKIVSCKWYWWNWSGANFQISYAPAISVARHAPKSGRETCWWNRAETWHPPTCRIVNSDLPKWFGVSLHEHRASTRVLCHEGCSWHLFSLPESQQKFQNLKMWPDCIKKTSRWNLILIPLKRKPRRKLILPSFPKKASAESRSPHLYFPPRSGATVEICIFPQLSCRLKFHKKDVFPL